jgi:hypothetical protein
MNRYDDYNNSFSSLTSSSSVGVAPKSIPSWNIRASNRHIDQCKSCTCCNRCGKKRLTETKTSSGKGNHINPAPILPLSSSILNRSTSKLSSYNQK